MRAALLAHPRHVALLAVVSGLAGGPLAAAVAAVVLAALLAGRRALVALVVVAAFGGAWVAQARTAALERTALAGPARAGLTVVQDVVLLAPVRTGARGSRTALVRLRGEPVLLRLPGPAQGPAPTVGTVLAIRGRLAPADRHARLLRAHAVLRAATVAPTGRRRGGVPGALDRVRDRAQAALVAALRPDAGALLRGMVLGDDSGLPDRLRDALRDAGLAHLVAASGQNVVLLATLVLLVGAALGLPLSARLGVALVLVALYVPLAGAGPSIQRAGVMGAAGLVAALAGRPASRWYAVLLAAAATLVLDPRATGDVGWRLSFLAVLGLLVAAPPLRAALVRRRVPGPLADALATTVAATLATAPLLALTFGQTSLVTLPANVLAAPLVAPVMWTGFVAATLGQGLPAIGAQVASLAALPLELLVAVGVRAAAIPGATAAVPAALVTAVCGLGLAAIRWPRVRAATPGLLLALVALGLALAPRPEAVLARPAGLRLAFLDVGQGDATLVQHGDHAILVDAGPPDGGVVERLAQLGVRRLDVLVVTHAQDDHDGGAPAVLDALPVGLVLDGRDGQPSAQGPRLVAAARARRVPRRPPDRGQLVRAGPITLRVLSPVAEPAARHAGEDPNDRAIVLELVAGAFRALLPADAESAVLLGLPDLRAADVLKVSHHGSADDALPRLLERVDPYLAVVSAGRGNRFGHPHPDTVRALAARPGLAVRRTDRDGTVVVDVRAGGPLVRTLR
ncbi:MBL fold metallo-hydrolase [Conexibacter sp. W3-3-2]|uniref:ComEC/Rec2 family competence protein n=1 Tax=Conexibacter sp. W3-3-2 TaxID=2675227 RepID=UPI0012B964CD|nr:ComEC/Rec2 family competence protein [Conexibacter sp. W3-3-2]MTD42803.1 MBL fold metallo-hydrolase [Conexibacter sp. W3-3-2]